MFPNVRLLIAAVVASVVALSCGFAMFAAFRVNHEPLSRLATGAAPLQLAAGNPIPSVAMPLPADSFGNRFPLNQADSAGASPEATPRQPDHDQRCRQRSGDGDENHLACLPRRIVEKYHTAVRDSASSTDNGGDQPSSARVRLMSTTSEPHSRPI